MQISVAPLNYNPLEFQAPSDSPTLTQNYGNSATTRHGAIICNYARVWPLQILSVSYRAYFSPPSYSRSRCSTKWPLQTSSPTVLASTAMQRTSHHHSCELSLLAPVLLSCFLPVQYSSVITARPSLEAAQRFTPRRTPT